jgi:hypothetical protein
VTVLAIEPTTLLGVIGGTSLVAAAMIARLPIAMCSECPHCRAAARQDADEQQRLSDELDRRWNSKPICPGCGRRHDPGAGP